MSRNPAEFYGLEPWPVAEGGVADLVIFAPEEIWEVDGFASKASNSPFSGWKLPGRGHVTICGGNIVYQA